MGKFIDICGERFGKLTVIKKSENRKELVQWICLCDCGKETLATSKKLRSGRKRSCGCLWLPAVVAAKTKHGHSSGGHVSVELHTWMQMRSRCTNPSNKGYPRYGGRGIKVCERWDDFQNFIDDMGHRPSPGHSIERVNNDGHYEPGNCKWATKYEQCRNRSNNIFIEYDGIKMCVRDASDLCGIKRETLYFRIKSGWSEDRLFTPTAR